MSFLIGLVVFLLIAVILAALLKPRISMWYNEWNTEEEVVTTTTTTTVHHNDESPQYVIEGTLIKYTDDNGQPYVIDPVDKARWNLNTTDDMYEDADGKIWKVL